MGVGDLWLLWLQVGDEQESKKGRGRVSGRNEGREGERRGRGECGEGRYIHAHVHVQHTCVLR